MRLTAQLADCFDDLGDATAVRRMIAAQSAAVGVEWQLADAGDEIAVGDEFPALPLVAEAKIFQLHQYRNGEAVVDCGVFDIGGPDACHFPCRRPGPARTG